MTIHYTIAGAYTKPARSLEVCEVNSMVDRVVLDHVSSGSTKLAIGAAAAILCLGLRRTRGHYHNEVAVVTAEQLDCVRTAYAEYLRRRLDDLDWEVQWIAAWLTSHEERLVVGAGADAFPG